MLKYAWWYVLGLLFRFVRPVIVLDCDWREDYSCVVCCAPVLTRKLTCSRRCAAEREATLASLQ